MRDRVFRTDWSGKVERGVKFPTTRIVSWRVEYGVWCKCGMKQVFSVYQHALTWAESHKEGFHNYSWADAVDCVDPHERLAAALDRALKADTDAQVDADARRGYSLK